MGVILLVPVFLVLVAAFIGTVAVAPRTYSARRRLATGCGVVLVILALTLAFLTMLILRL